MNTSPNNSVLDNHDQVGHVPNVSVTDGACMACTACRNPLLSHMVLMARATNFAVNEIARRKL